MLRDEFESAGFVRVLVLFVVVLVGAVLVMDLHPSIIQSDLHGIRSFLP